jgi:hypothetical protein
LNGILARVFRNRAKGFLLATLLAAAAAGAQPPDFSGKWAVAPPERAAGVAMGSAPPTLSELGTMGSGWASEITLAQSAAALVVVCEYFHPRDAQPPFRLSYALDGAESRNTVNLGRGPQVQVSTAGWRGASLVITTTHAFVNPSDGRAMTSETRQVLSLAAPDTLVIETFRSAVLGGKASTTRTTYRKRGPS